MPPLQFAISGIAHKWSQTICGPLCWLLSLSTMLLKSIFVRPTSSYPPGFHSLLEHLKLTPTCGLTHQRIQPLLSGVRATFVFKAPRWFQEAPRFENHQPIPRFSVLHANPCPSRELERSHFIGEELKAWAKGKYLAQDHTQWWEKYDANSSPFPAHIPSPTSLQAKEKTSHCDKESVLILQRGPGKFLLKKKKKNSKNLAGGGWKASKQFQSMTALLHASTV